MESIESSEDVVDQVCKRKYKCDNHIVCCIAYFTKKRCMLESIPFCDDRRTSVGYSR
jgi:hypothetical protein